MSEALTRAARDVYVPGVWRCVKCEFRLVQATLNARDGTVTARDEPGEPCPNCASPLWRVSWKDEAKEAYVLAEAALDAGEPAYDKFRSAIVLAALRALVQEAAND